MPILSPCVFHLVCQHFPPNLSCPFFTCLFPTGHTAVFLLLQFHEQTSETTIGYREAVALVVEQDGWVGLFGRGLGTRLLTNSIQAVLFSVVWKLLEAEGLKLGLF